MENSAINPNLIGTKISEIQQSLERLSDIYRLITAIEAAISICNHIAARKFKRAPESYSDCFMIDEKIYVILSDELVDLENYIKEISNYMDKK